MARDASAHSREKLSRAARTARGAVGAFAATVLAAASHALAGGLVTPLGLAATFVLALPLCVALAGSPASLWRLSLGVSASQFIYHWSFAGLGAASGSSQFLAGAPSGHAHHVTPTVFIPTLAEAGGQGWAMWIAHAIAALATIALLATGERAILGLRTLIARLLPATLRVPAMPAVRTHSRGIISSGHSPRTRLISLSAISHRGPPTLLSPAS